MGNSICIITSVRNCMVETAEYLESLKRFPPKNLSEIIIVDDGSEEETQKFLSSKKGEIRVFRNLKSKGFAFSNNLGSAKSSAEWLLFMNNDLVLSRGWSDSFHSLIQDGESHDELGCVGNIQLDPVTRKIDHAGVVFSNGIPEHFCKGKKEAPTNYSSEHLAVTGACFLIKRELFLSVGGFDETYKTGFEDIDLCLRLSMLGYKHYVLNKSVILHKKSSTPERNQFQSHNSRIFYSRWGRVITRFQEWESAKRKLDLANQSSLKGYEYVLKKKEDFLFSDTKILNEYFSTFLKKKKFKFAKHILSILQKKFSHEENTQLKSAQFHFACEQFEQAVAILCDLLEVNPSQIDACLLLAKILIEKGEIQKAIKILGDAKKYHPDNAHIYSAISKCMLLNGKVKEAEGNARISTILDSELRAGWQSLLKVFQEKGQVKEEIKILRLLLDRYPKDIKIMNGLIAALSSLNLHGKIWGLSRKFEKRISTGESAFLCAQACYEIGDFNQCSIFLDKVLASDPENEKALMLSGNLAVANKDFPKAIRDYKHVLQAIPDSLEAFSNIANSKSFICDWSDREIEIEKLQTWYRKVLGKLGLFEVSGLYFDEANESKNAFAKAKSFNIQMKLLREKLGFSYRSNEEARKRIGFLSSDFRNHAVGHQFIGLLDNLDSNQYDIFLFATSPSENTEIRNSYEQLGENFHDISGLSLAGRASSINQADLDLLIDLGGFSRGHNAELLAMRPSPRQAHFLGYASSMGEGLVDYTIADPVVIPRSSSKFYGEKVIRMDGCFFPPGEFEGFAPRVKRKEVGLPPRGFVFCAFHAAYKLDLELWSSWMRILKAVPESVLWLKFKPANDAFKNLKKEAVRSGVSSKRIILAEDLSNRKDHLSRMTVADLYLDCPLYNGHASAMDALHAKLPILTVKGKRFCSRVGETFMKNLGLPEMVAKNLDEYEKQAIELGRRPSRLLPLRKKISENADAVLSPVLHAERFQSAIEQILSKKPKISKALKTAKPKASSEITDALSLEDFTLVMVRPIGITNWAYNVNMLAHELRKNGGQTIIIEASHPEHKRSDFSSFVKRIPQLGQSYANILNLGLSKVSTKYLFYLDDPLRALPAKHFAECLYQAKKTLLESKIGFVGLGSNMEPNTGVLVTTTQASSGSKIGGLFAPTFALNLDVLTYTGGFRPNYDSIAFSCLDLSLRMEQQGYRSVLVELDKLICPAHTGNDYLKSTGESTLTHFIQFWNVKPVSLKPKYPAKEEQVGETPDYQEWIKLCDTITEDDISAFMAEAGKLQNKPLISMIMPVFDPPKKFLIKAIESVISQAYENWELCIADDASTKKFVRPLLESYARKDSRIKVKFRKTNGHISVASNSALKLAIGEFVAFLDHDDELRPHSLLEVAKIINQNPHARLIYSDEDKVDEQGRRYDAYFKPDWNPDLLLGQNYISHFSVFETTLVKKLKGLRKGYEGSQDWDLTLRFTEQIKKTCILHIPKVLYHWRAIKGSTASHISQKSNILNTSRKVISNAFFRRNIKASTGFISEDSNYIWAKYQIDRKDSPIVSIIIPFKDRVDLLEKCISSILSTIKYANIEIIIVDNESIEKQSQSYLDAVQKDTRFTVLEILGNFNYSKLNNLAVEKAKGEILLLLNNDIEATCEGWFEEMLSHVLRTGIGCVGAKLLYPNGQLQHGGVIIGKNGVASHFQKFTPKGLSGYFGNLALTRNSSAVTAACLMVRKNIYRQIGGFDENKLKVAFNDVDFCLRVEKLDCRNVWTPKAELIHHESASRGDDNSNSEKKTRFVNEISTIFNRWNSRNYLDSCYNPNLTKLSDRNWYGITHTQEFINKNKEASSGDKNIYDSGECYRKLFRDILVQKGECEATFLTVGGKSEKIGQVTFEVLKVLGLKDNDFLVDVGCGFGRLAKALNGNHKGKYLGTDVVPELLNYAKANFLQEDWSFELVDQLLIPAEDSSVDMVCFFSVFTHLLHQQSFIYLKEVKRVLKIGGRVVFSFLDFKESAHIQHFERSVSGLSSGHPLNVFMSEDLIRAWADLLDFECEFVVGSEEKHRKGHPFTEFGQSIACLRKSKESHSIPKQSFPQKLARNQYKETWNDLSNSFDSAKIYVTGEADEDELKNSALESIARINRFVKFSGKDGVLEIGCGIGRVGKELAPKCRKWIGCDISGNMLGHAQRRLSHLKNIELVELPECNLSPIADSSIDVVYCTVVFMHLDEWDRYEYIKEAFRVLKPGGRAYFDNFSLTTEGGWKIFKAHHAMSDRPSHISKSSTTEELSRYMEKAKFVEVKIELDDPWVIASGCKFTQVNDDPSGHRLIELNSNELVTVEKRTGNSLFTQRKEIYQNLSGNGLEIGAFEHPAELPSSCEVKYFDRISTEQAKDLFPEISHKKLPKVDIIGDLDEKGLEQIPSESFEFVIMNHVLEHLINPIQVIKESLRILKPGGSLVMSVPDKRFTFDFERKLTKWDSLLKRYQKELNKPKLENYEEIYQVHYNLKGKTLSKKEKISFLKECMERRAHLNVWDSESFKTFLMRTLEFSDVEVNFEREVSGNESHFEYLVHLKKINCSNSNFNLNKIKSYIEVLSLHIPKTGGTSFRKCLSKIYGNNFIPHYPELEKQGSESLDALINGKCVHGHLILDRYQELCEGAALVTWLRNPVDRTLSLYHHILSNPDSSNEFHQRVYRDKPSILEFCEMPENQNQLFYWIGDRNPEDFKFIGFLETAQASIVKCTSTLGWSHVPKLSWSNKTPKRNILQVSPSEREFIKAKNQDEWLWIEKAKEIFG